MDFFVVLSGRSAAAKAFCKGVLGTLSDHRQQISDSDEVVTNRVRLIANCIASIESTVKC